MCMAEDKIKMPASFGGLTRYFDEYKSSLEFKPQYVVVAIVIVIIFEFGLRLFS